MAFTKQSQIKGIRKALKNRRTPKQFKAGLRKRLKQLSG